ncbi:hypothetical protein KVE30_00995 [Helicobacter pylori]|nr:hypothetical protein KVE30_00995 [Helicobacter pylori]
MQEKIIKVIPGLLFLFSILSIFELCLIIEDMNKTEKLEAEVKKNLEVLETITEFLKHSEGMCLKEQPKIKTFKNR